MGGSRCGLNPGAAIDSRQRVGAVESRGARIGPPNQPVFAPHFAELKLRQEPARAFRPPAQVSVIRIVDVHFFEMVGAEWEFRARSLFRASQGQKQRFSRFDLCKMF